MADKRRNALASPEMRETPVRNRLAQYAGNALTAVDEFARAPFGFQNPPVAMLSDALGVPAVASTLNRLAYGDRLTQGSGQTLQIRPDVLEAAMAAAPVAAKFPKATLGAAGMLAGAADTGAGRAMFIGANAKTWDAAAAAKAAQLEAAGKDARAIWQETGTFRGADGKLRQEIDDSGAKLVDSLSDNLSDKRSLDRFWEHQPLFDAYPDSRTIKYMPTDSIKSGEGSYTRPEDLIKVGMSGYGGNPMSTTVHELQHAIQGREGFATGGNPDSMRLADVAEPWMVDSVKNSHQYRMAVAQGRRPEEVLDAMIAPYMSETGNASSARHQAYQRLAGEAEARATQARMNMNAKQRREVFPYDSYDVPVNSLIVR